MNKQVTPRQLELLLDFVEQHRPLALGRVRGKERSLLSNSLWAKCAKNLNTDCKGAQKSAAQWKKYYNQYKCRVKAKIHGHRGTGSSGNDLNLTPLEQRLFNIVSGSISPVNDKHNTLDVLDNDSDGGIAEGQGAVKEDAVQCGEEIYLVDYSNEVPELIREGGGNETPKIERLSGSVSPKAKSELPLETDTMFWHSIVEVDRQLASAINRHAAAMENLAGQAKRFVDIYEKKERRLEAEASRSTNSKREEGDIL